MRKGNIFYYDLALIGGGHAHLAVLESLANKAVLGLRCCLVTPSPQSIYSGMLPGWMAGFFGDEDIQIDVAALARAAGITFFLDEAVGLDVARKCVRLASGRMIGYSRLSLATGGETNLSHLATLGERLISAKPVDRFFDRWPVVWSELVGMAAPSVAIVGGGAAGCELALAVRAAVGPKSGLTLVAGEGGVLTGFPLRIRRLMDASLQAAGIAVATSDAAGTRDGLLLSNGASLHCDVVIAATGSRAPDWLKNSGLALSPDGYVIVDGSMRSISNDDVFAAGDITSRMDRSMERSGVHAVKSGPVLAHNLRAQFEEIPMRAYRPRRQSLYILSTANEQALLSWRGLSFGGRLAWWIKKAIDRNFINRYRKLSTGAERTH